MYTKCLTNQVLTKEICPKNGFSIPSFSTAGDPRKELDQEGDSGEENVGEHSGCGRHLQEENTGDQVEYAVSKKYLQYSNIFEKIMIYET